MIANHDLKTAVCPTCTSEVRVDVLFEERTSWHDDNVSGSDRYWTLRCRGCDRIFFGHGSCFSENYDHEYDHNIGDYRIVAIEEKTFYPRSLKRKKPDWFTWRFQSDKHEIAVILIEVYSALDHDLLNLAATGIRTVFDLLAIELKVDRSKSFKEKIENLRKDEHITAREKDYLQLLVDAGGAAVHAGWTPSNDEVTTLMEILEGTVHRALILPQKLESVRSSLLIAKE